VLGRGQVPAPNRSRRTKYRHGFARTAGQTHHFPPAPLHFIAFRRTQTAETGKDMGADTHVPVAGNAWDLVEVKSTMVLEQKRPQRTPERTPNWTLIYINYSVITWFIRGLCIAATRRRLEQSLAAVPQRLLAEPRTGLQDPT
jgi:hypothetical protein